MMDIIKWLALNWGEKYPVLSTLGAMALAAILWNVLIRMNADNLPKTPPSITQTTTETTGKVLPTVSNNQGGVNVTNTPPDEKQKEK